MGRKRALSRLRAGAAQPVPRVAAPPRTTSESLGVGGKGRRPAHSPTCETPRKQLVLDGDVTGTHEREADMLKHMVLNMPAKYISIGGSHACSVGQTTAAGAEDRGIVTCTQRTQHTLSIFSTLIYVGTDYSRT